MSKALWLCGLDFSCFKFKRLLCNQLDGCMDFIDFVLSESFLSHIIVLYRLYCSISAFVSQIWHSSAEVGWWKSCVNLENAALNVSELCGMRRHRAGCCTGRSRKVTYCWVCLTASTMTSSSFLFKTWPRRWSRFSPMQLYRSSIGFVYFCLYSN